MVAISETAITDEALEYVARMDSMTELQCGHNEISDKGIAHLDGHPALEIVFLINQKGVTDVSLKYLQRVPKLRRAELKGTSVTEAGVNGLQVALPACQITWDGTR
jgi:hypothetical protein